MARLSDTQLLILSAAAQREDGKALPLPDTLRGGAAAKVVAALLSRGLVAERVTDSRVEADAARNAFWRNDEAGRAILLRITPEGLAAIGVEPEDAPNVAESAPETAEEPRNDGEARGAHRETPAPPKTREGTKQAKLIEMLKAESGATIDEMTAATGWQAHTVRGAMAGALKKKLGLAITSDKEERGRVYRIAD